MSEYKYTSYVTEKEVSFVLENVNFGENSDFEGKYSIEATIKAQNGELGIMEWVNECDGDYEIEQTDSNIKTNCTELLAEIFNVNDGSRFINELVTEIHKALQSELDKLS